MAKNDKYVYAGLSILFLCNTIFVKWNGDYSGKIFSLLLALALIFNFITDNAIQKILRTTLLIIGIVVIILDFGFHYFTIG